MDYTFVNLKHTVETQANKSYTKGISVLKKYLSKVNSNGAREQLASDYANLGQLQECIDVYKTLIDNNPGSVSYLDDLAGIYSAAQQYPVALDYYKQIIDIAPSVGLYWENLAKTYEAMGKTDEAKDAYRKAILYYPVNYDARKALRKLEKKKDVFDYFDQPDVYDVIKKAPDAAQYPEDNSVVLLDEVQKVVYDGGATEEKHILVGKVFNADGIDRWKHYNIYSGMRLIIEKAETVKANGSKVAAETDDGSVVFTSLEAGDAVHLTYRLESYATGKIGAHFSDDCYFSYGTPYLKTKYSLLISPNVKFEYKFNHDPIEAQVKTMDDFKMYSWEKENQASLKQEEKMPEGADVAQILYLSSYPDWNYISNWYNDLASTKAKSDFEVKETVASLFEGKQNLSQMDKVKEIYNYIVKNIRYSSVSFLQSGLIPQKASHVLNTKIGDCKDVATLFVAMCKEIGVPAELVLVKTSNYGRTGLLLPSIDFNHCIGKFTLDNKDYYIELTSDYLPFNSFYGMDINAFVLNVKSDKEKGTIAPFHMNPPTRNRNEIMRTSQVSLDNNDLIIEKTVYKSGARAAYLRSTYRDLGKKEQEKEMQKSLTGEYPVVTLNSLVFEGLADRSDTVVSKIKYTASSAVTQVSGLSLFSLPWADKADPHDFVINADRQFPIDLSDYASIDREAETLSVTIPAGHILSEIPKTVSYSCAAADYKLTFSVKGNKVTATRELKFKADIIPLDQIKEFSEFYKKVISADAKQLALK
jgi:hypothetical protein